MLLDAANVAGKLVRIQTNAERAILGKKSWKK